jgi:hypothetical protein
VTLFRGRLDGDWAQDRGRTGSMSCLVGGVYGNGGACGAVEIRFIRRASVGLIVRAPRPVACGGITDTLFADEAGVVALPAGFLIGVRTALVEHDREWSVNPDAVSRWSPGSREGGWSDLAFMLRRLEGSLVLSRPLESRFWACGRRLAWSAGAVSTLAFRADTL